MPWRTRRQILLGDPVILERVGVHVPFPVTEALLVPAGIAQMVRNLAFALFGLEQGQRVEETHCRVRLRRRRQVQRRVREVKPSLGHAHPVERCRGGLDEAQRPGVGHAHVLAGKDEHAAEDVVRVLARPHHAGQPVQRRVRVRPADRLDVGADRVEVVVALLVVEHHLALDAFLRDFPGDEDLRAAGGGKRSGVVSTASSMAFRRLRASPWAIFTRWSSASSVNTTFHAP